MYLQVIEELAMRWAAVAVATSVHTLACYTVFTHGTPEQRDRWLPRMLAGELIGGYSLSEPQAGSDAGALTCRAERVADGYRVTGNKAWITHGGASPTSTPLFARTGSGSRGVSCFLAPGSADGLTFGRPEEKMGLHAVPTTSAHWDGVLVDADRLIGEEGQGLQIAFSALDSGRLGIAACATGLAQAALDEAVAYAKERQTFGKRIIDHQGLGFLLADMAAAVDTARAMYLDAARRRDAGLPYGRHASIAKLVATDAAMKVTTDAVQVFGGVRVYAGVSGGEVHARSEDHADLRRHQPDPEIGDQPRPGQIEVGSTAIVTSIHLQAIRRYRREERLLLRFAHGTHGDPDRDAVRPRLPRP
ncbi:hypothetical protein GCM10020001_074670 [Nonomuraea salmonea]